MGLSQEETARRCMVSLSTWQNWESSRFTPGVNKYPDLAAALGISIAEVQDCVREIELHILKTRRVV